MSEAMCQSEGCVRDRGAAQVRPSAGEGLRVCVECLNRLQRNLKAVPELYNCCEKVLATPPAKAERVSRSRSFGIALNVMAIDARDLLRSRLSSWSDLVVTERQCTAPARTIAAMASFLQLNAVWLCAHSAAPDVVSEIAEAVAMARQAAFPHWARKFRVGPCVERDCDGFLFAVIQSGERLLPSEVRCEADRDHVWPAYQWRELDRRVNQKPAGGTRWLTVGEVAQLWGLSTSNVYRLASVHSWRRRVSGRRVFYYEVDVAESVK
jgi:hypothetical protein